MPWRRECASSASARSRNPRRLRHLVSGSARDTRDSSHRCRSWLRACQALITAVQASEKAKKKTWGLPASPSVAAMPRYTATLTTPTTMTEGSG